MSLAEGMGLIRSTKGVAVAAIFGVVIFVTKTLVPSPFNKMLVMIQALLLAVSGLLFGRMGATYVALVGGSLTALWNFALAPFTLAFALLFGLLVDGFFLLFRVRMVEGRARILRLVSAMTLSTMVVGVLSYSVTIYLGLVPRSITFEALILVMGTISGALAGYLASRIWNRYLRNMSF